MSEELNQANSEWTALLAILECWRKQSPGRHWVIESKYVPQPEVETPYYTEALALSEDSSFIAVECFSDCESTQKFEADRLEWIIRKARHELRSVEDSRP